MMRLAYNAFVFGKGILGDLHICTLLLRSADAKEANVFSACFIAAFKSLDGAEEIWLAE